MASFEYETEPLDETEEVRGVFYGGRGNVGQQIVVTNRRLLLGPISTGVAEEIDTWLLDKASAGAGDLVKSVLSQYAPMKPTTIWLRHVANVEATDDASWWTPWRMAGLRITTDTDQRYELGMVASVGTPSGSGKNNPVRDRALQTIAEAVASAKSAPPAAGDARAGS